MSFNKTDDAVAEYLHELELRLSGLPVLQRRELLGDLEAHITNERIERAVVSESEVLEILERLGSPEVVAAAAYEEAGMLHPLGAGAPGGLGARRLPPVPPPPDPPPFVGSLFDSPPPTFTTPPAFTAPPAKQGMETGARVAIVMAAVSAVFLVLFCLAGGMLMARSSGDVPASSVVVDAPPMPEEMEPVPAETAPLPGN